MYTGVPQHTGKRRPRAHKAQPFYEHFGGEFSGHLIWTTVIGYPEQHLKLLVNLNEVVSAIWPCPAHVVVFVVFPSIVFFMESLPSLASP